MFIPDLSPNFSILDLQFRVKNIPDPVSGSASNQSIVNPKYQCCGSGISGSGMNNPDTS
jgi:hypothetical protein